MEKRIGLGNYWRRCVDSIVLLSTHFFITKYNRFPNLDELYDVDSEPYLRSQLKGIRNSCKLSDLLELTHTNSV